MPLPLLLLGAGKFIGGKLLAAGAHHALVAGAAHASPQVLAHAGYGAMQATINAAIASGSVVAGIAIIGGTAIAVLKFCGDVEKYRELNHIDQYGRRKEEFRQVERCDVCGDDIIDGPSSGIRLSEAFPDSKTFCDQEATTTSEGSSYGPVVTINVHE